MAILCSKADAYNILSLGTPFLATDKAISELYGPVPVAFVKLVPGKKHLNFGRGSTDLDGRLSKMVWNRISCHKSYSSKLLQLNSPDARKTFFIDAL